MDQGLSVSNELQYALVASSTDSLVINRDHSCPLNHLLYIFNSLKDCYIIFVCTFVCVRARREG